MVLGDSCVGKTTLLFSHTHDKYIDCREYPYYKGIPVFEKKLTIDDKVIQLQPKDTETSPHNDLYERFRPIFYPRMVLLFNLLIRVIHVHGSDLQGGGKVHNLGLSRVGKIIFLSYGGG